MKASDTMKIIFIHSKREIPLCKHGVGTIRLNISRLSSSTREKRTRSRLSIHTSYWTSGVSLQVWLPCTLHKMARSVAKCGTRVAHIDRQVEPSKCGLPGVKKGRIHKCIHNRKYNTFKPGHAITIINKYLLHTLK